MSIYDMIIVGGGPAGLAGAVYAARKRLQTLLVSVDIGGQLNTTLDIENYLGYQFIEGPELISKFQTQVSQFPIDQRIGERVTRVNRADGHYEVVTEAGGRYQGKVVVYAAGKKPRKLNVPGEAEFAGRGVSYCAVCDGPLFAEKKVVVVGGGNSGLEAALDMVKIAEHVTVVALEITGDAILREQLSGAENLIMLTAHETTGIRGEQFVQEVDIRDVKSGETKKLETAAVFVEIGMEPNSEAVHELVRLNDRGEVPVNCRNETGVPGLYAAGDVTDVPEKQIIVAAGEGAKAALQAHRYLQRLR